ncbi:reticulon-4-interacting protein 1 homolog, mitochondrial-like isoform X1 [Schistocerca americana]|uniref:reticulon-4-interacting protein 1 homolog, mitochondrial-like isoform X1 n=1 Tax=Schistocerca americana TaxID=7009 RepID=UPI001F50015D|nr:reticulon-4-interacting protein 1 homolog, mitochondrial-like isoform X1 [Schistocerca americana]
MDELIFHASQRLEALQIRLLCSVQNFRNSVQVYSEQIQNAVVEALNSPRGLYVQEGLHNTWAAVLRVGNDVKSVANREYIYDVYTRVLRIVLSDAYDLNVYYSCLFFVVGGALGFTIGLSWRRTPQSSQRMKAIGCSYYGGIDAVQLLDDVPIPSVKKPDELLIQVKAASLDPVDILICSGYGRVLRRLLHRYNSNVKQEFPIVLGRDCAGIVIEIGQKVNHFDIGDEVWFSIPYWLSGTLAEYVVITENLIAKKPKGIRFEVAASVPYSGMIAWNAVVSQAHLNSVAASGKRILVHTGCTAVGVIILQLARLWGVHVTVTCPHRAIPVAQALGADCIVSDQQPDVEKQLSEHDRFDFVFNTVGHAADDLCLKFCKDDGLVITTVASPLAADNYGLIFRLLYSLWVRLKCFFRVCVGANAWSLMDESLVPLNELGKLVEDGSLQPVVDKIFSPQDAELAFQHADSCDAVGKTIIRFRPQITGNPSAGRKKSLKRIKHVS